MSERLEGKAAGGFLVYVRSYGRVCPQWWSELYFGERGDRRAAVVAIIPLQEADANLSLHELARLHPLTPGVDAPPTGATR